MIWLELEQLKELGVSRGMLVRNRDRWTTRATGKRGRNGKPIHEYLLESLPERFRSAWLAANKPQADVIEISSYLTTENEIPEPLVGGGTEEAAVADSGERRLTEALTRYREETRSSFLEEAERLLSIVERYRAIEPKRTRGADGKYEYTKAVLDLCEATACTDPVILAVEPSRSKPRSPHAVDQWSKRAKQDGLATFLRQPPKPTGNPDKRKAEISAAAIEWINANWRKTPSAERLWKECKKQATKHGWTIPARGWFWRKYQSIPEVTRTITYDGMKAYTGRLAPYVPRDVRDIDALQVLVGDHSVRDITVMLPDGSLTRPWLTLWQDLRTGLIWGWHLDIVPSSTTIALAYANGVQNFGAQPPANPNADYYSWLYTDQGKDYKCHQIAGQTLEFRSENYGKAGTIEGGLNSLCVQREVGLMNDLGLKHMMARGYNAREKFVERTHKDISAWERDTFRDEYCGNGKGHRPERWAAAWHRHEKLRKKVGKNLDWLRSESPFMTLDDYRDAIGGWIHEYNHIEHTRVVLGGATVVPVDEYERLYRTRFEIADETLAMLLMRSARRKIGKNGVQMFQPHWFFIAEEMSEFKGREIEIRYNDQDYTKIYAVLPNGQIVEAEMVGNSGVLNPSKRTMGLVAKQRNHEIKLAREYQLVQQSNWRGETAEDRVNAMMAIEPDAPESESKKQAVNERPRVHVIGRFDKSKIISAGRPSVTAEMVENTNVIDGMFSNRTVEKKRIKEEWED